MLSARQRGLNYVVLFLFAALVIYPLAGVFSVALSPPSSQITGLTFTHVWSLGSFRTVLSTGGFTRSLLNSALVAFIVVVGGIVLSSMAAFSIGTLKLPGLNVVFLLLLVGLMVPEEATIIPVYHLLERLGLLNTYWGVILPQLGQSVAFGTFWLRTWFASVPRSIIDASRLDGADSWTLLWRVLVPMGGPAVRTLAALLFLFTWHEFLLPLVTISTPSLNTVTVALSQFQGQHFTNYSVTGAGAVVVAVPVVIVYLFAQRHFIAGVLGGSVVE